MEAGGQKGAAGPGAPRYPGRLTTCHVEQSQGTRACGRMGRVCPAFLRSGSFQGPRQPQRLKMLVGSG